VISVADPEPLERVKEDLQASGFGATIERHGIICFLLTDASWDRLPGILLDHFQTYYRYEDHGSARVKVTDPDGGVELDDREDWMVGEGPELP
jgi:hypothetical protein